MQGKVIWYNPKMGYGFIKGDNGDSYFVHQTNIQMEGFRKLKRNQTVSFVAEEAEDGRAIAKEVCVVE